MGRNSKLFKGVIAALAITLTATACANDGGEGGNGEDMPKVRVAVGIDPAYAPFFVADKAGLFEEEGVDVEIVQFGRGGEGVDAVGAGEVHMVGNSDVTTTAQMAANDKLRALATYQESDKYMKAVMRNGVESAEDIENFGYVPGVSQLSGELWLESEGVATDSVNMVQASPADLPTLLQRGDIDAYLAWEPWPQMAVDQGTGRVVATTGDFDFAYYHWLITNADWLADNEEAAQGVARALAKAADQVEEDPDLAAEATEEAVNIKVEDTLTAIDQIDFEVLPLNDESVTHTETIVDFYERIGAINNRPDLDTMMIVDWYKG